MEEPEQLKRSLIHATAGAISGGVSRTVTSPLDVIKIRFQVQLEPITTRWVHGVGKSFHGRPKYSGIFQAARDIFREERLPGFWRGNVPALLMVVPYTAIQFAFLQKVKAIADGTSNRGIAIEDHEQLTSYLPYISGAVAGVAATVGSYPFDLLRTILASQGEPKVYPTMRSAFKDVIKTRGVRGLYAGLSPTLVEIVPYAGLQFGTYDTFKRWCKSWNCYKYTEPNSSSSSESNDVSRFQLFVCGFGSSACAKLVCHPLDVVKKRFQIEGLERHPKYGARVEQSGYRNMYDALQQIWQLEGRGGLYKGIIPSVVKAAPAGALTFVVYEFTSDWLELNMMNSYFS